MLSGVDLFAGLSKRQAKRLLARAREVTHVKGSEVASEGGGALGFHLILSGRATVTHGSRAIRSLGAGDYFGEISMIDGLPRSATVTIDDDMHALAIDHGVFETVLDEQPDFARGLLKGLCARLREAEAREASADV
jgi:CRP-like cAMP-binding protein